MKRTMWKNVFFTGLVTPGSDRFDSALDLLRCTMRFEAFESNAVLPVCPMAFGGREKSRRVESEVHNQRR